MVLNAQFIPHRNETNENITFLNPPGHNTPDDEHFGTTFVCAAILPVVTVFVFLAIWRVLQPMCDRAAASAARPESITRNGLASSLGYYSRHRDSLVVSTVQDLHSIFILDIRALPLHRNSTTDETYKVEPPPPYEFDDEMLSLPSYDEAIKNIKENNLPDVHITTHG